MDLNRNQSRRELLKQIGTVGGASLALYGGMFATEHFSAHAGAAANPINHVIVACQENRTFD